MNILKLTYVGPLAIALLGALCIVGCAGPVAAVQPELTPRTLADVRQATLAVAQPDHPRVALVLGGGGLRGFAHLGVLRALEEAGIQPDIVVGTSAGAVVGAAYASGMSASQVESIARNVKLSSLIDLTFSSSGLMRGDKIARWVDTFTAGVPIEKFPRRFAAVATDLRSGTALLLDSGSPGAAVQASAAVPGPQVPVAYKGGHLVDGGIASLVPVRFARALGADFVVAVDIYCQGPPGEGLAMPSILLQVMRVQSCMVAAPEMAEADVLISPAVSVSGMSAKEDQERAIASGYEATLAVVPQLKTHLEKAKPRIDPAAVAVAAGGSPSATLSVVRP